MFVNSDGSGGAVLDGGAVGCWMPCEQVNFNYQFIQSTSAARPGFGQSISPLGPVVYGNGTSWKMTLNSSTAIDIDCTLLCTGEFSNVGATGKSLWAQNNFQWSAQISGSSANPTILFNNSVELGDSLPQCRQVEGNGTTGGRFIRMAISSGAGTERYGSPLTLFSRFSGTYFSPFRLREFAITPRLTASECMSAIACLS